MRAARMVMGDGQAVELCYRAMEVDAELRRATAVGEDMRTREDAQARTAPSPNHCKITYKKLRTRCMARDLLILGWE